MLEFLKVWQITANPLENHMGKYLALDTDQSKTPVAAEILANPFTFPDRDALVTNFQKGVNTPHKPWRVGEPPALGKCHRPRAFQPLNPATASLTSRESAVFPVS